jgi:hypothetical protein
MLRIATFEFALLLASCSVLTAQEANIKWPVPSPDDAVEAINNVRDIFTDEYDQAKNVDQKSALASRLVQIANSNQDALGNYGLLVEAKRFAVEAESVALANQVIDRFDAKFEIDALLMRAKTLYALSMATRSADVRKQIVDSADALVTDALAENRIELAGKTVKFAIGIARSARLTVMISKLSKRGQHITKLDREFQRVAKALTLLGMVPTDPDANLTAGRWHCFVQEQWEQGVPMLALGSDEELKKLAIDDLSAPANDDERIRLGDQWWELGENSKGPEQAAIWRHAATWYRLALPSATGIQEKKLELRIAKTGIKPVQDKPVPVANPTSVSLDGSEYILTNLTYDGSYPITLEAVVLPDRIGSDARFLSNAHYSGLLLGIGRDGHWHCGVRDQSSAQFAKSDQPASQQDKTHVAGVFDGRQMRLFVNGKLQSAVAKLGSPHKASKRAFLIGGDPMGLFPAEFMFPGKVYYARVTKGVAYNANFTPAILDRPDRATLLLFRPDQLPISASAARSRPSPLLRSKMLLRRQRSTLTPSNRVAKYQVAVPAFGDGKERRMLELATNKLGDDEPDFGMRIAILDEKGRPVFQRFAKSHEYETFRIPVTPNSTWTVVLSDENTVQGNNFELEVWLSKSLIK